MSRLKAETLSIRTSTEIKQLLRMAAERERRSVAPMLEILVLGTSGNMDRRHKLFSYQSPKGLSRNDASPVEAHFR